MIDNEKITLKFDELDLSRGERLLLKEIENEPGGVLDFVMRSGGTRIEIALRDKLCEKLRDEVGHIFDDDKDTVDELNRALKGRPKIKKRPQLDIDIKL